MSNLTFADLLSVDSVRDGMQVRFHMRHLNEANARELMAELFELAARGSGPYLYLDLSEVESLTYHILMRLIVLSKKLQDLGDRLLLLNPSPRVREAIATSHLSEFLSLRSRA
jgi:anti-anti-sigma regulatory factor